jgi:hypothetical protein
MLAKHLAVSLVTWLACQQVSAQVINIPPDPNIGDNGSIGTGTTLNLHAGGMIGKSFDAGASNGTSANVEVNILGGSVGNEFAANRGSEVNISGGFVGDDFAAHPGSLINISGGSVGRRFVATDSQVNISGGDVGRDYLALTNSSLQMSGGTLGFFLNVGAADGSSTHVDAFVSGGVLRPGIEVNQGATMEFVGGRISRSSSFGIDWNNGSLGHVRGGIVDTAFDTFTGADVHLYGNDFFLDDDPIVVIGPTKIDIPSGKILSGILSDGTPFALGEPLLDDTQPDTLTLHAEVLPPLGATVINVPPEIAPPSIRGGQTLNLFQNGELPESFRAGPGSTVNITGGTALGGMEVRGATLNISGGNVFSDFVALGGSELNISGGSFGSFSEIFNSTVNLSGGNFGDASQAHLGAVINVSGGVLGGVFGLSLGDGSEAHLSGGIINDLGASSGSTVSLTGGEFLLDGQPVAGLNTVGDSVIVNFQDKSQVVGVFQDGTPFAFAKTDEFFSVPLLTLRLAALPPIGPTTINLPGDPLPTGIRQGQTLTVGTGGIVGINTSSPANFVAGAGSVMNVEGGNVGSDLEATGATINLVSGTIGPRLDLFDGAVLNLSGGTLGNDAQVHAGGRANISGGTIQNTSSFTPALEVLPGGVVNVTGGSIGEGINVLGAELNISGGTIGARLFAVSDFATSTNAIVNVSGGTFAGSVQASIGSEFHLLGTEFLLDGIEIPGLVMDEPFTVTDRNVTLSGVLADGTPFDFDLNTQNAFNQDFFHHQALVTVTLVEPSAFAADLDNDNDVDGHDFLLIQSSNPSLFGQWESQFGARRQVAPVVREVPEPSAILLVLLVTAVGRFHAPTRNVRGITLPRRAYHKEDDYCKARVRMSPYVASHG